MANDRCELDWSGLIDTAASLFRPQPKPLTALLSANRTEFNTCPGPPSLLSVFFLCGPSHKEKNLKVWWQCDNLVAFVRTFIELFLYNKFINQHSSRSLSTSSLLEGSNLVGKSFFGVPSQDFELRSALQKADAHTSNRRPKVVLEGSREQLHCATPRQDFELRFALQ